MAASRAPEHSFCLLLASKQATRIISDALQRTLLRVMEDGLNCSSRDCHFIANFLCKVGLSFAPPEPRSSGQGRKHLFQILMNRDRSNMWILAKLSAVSTALALFGAEIKMNCDFFNYCSWCRERERERERERMLFLCSCELVNILDL
jgi:hypothetical protein